MPIGYTLKDLKGNVAKVAETSDYSLTTCTQNGFARFYVLDSKKTLRKNRRTDFGRMKPKWFIPVIQGKLTARRLR